MWTTPTLMSSSILLRYCYLMRFITLLHHVLISLCVFYCLYSYDLMSLCLYLLVPIASLTHYVNISYIHRLILVCYSDFIFLYLNNFVFRCFFSLYCISVLMYSCMFYIFVLFYACFVTSFVVLLNVCVLAFFVCCIYVFCIQ